MSKIYFTNVLDDPYYVSNGIFLSVVTNGKVRVEGEESRDYNKDSAAKAGLLKIDTKIFYVINIYYLMEKGSIYLIQPLEFIGTRTYKIGCLKNNNITD